MDELAFQYSTNDIIYSFDDNNNYQKYKYTQKRLKSNILFGRFRSPRVCCTRCGRMNEYWIGMNTIIITILIYI